MTGDTPRTDGDLDLPKEPIPVAVLTGFLGSGKTTLLDARPDDDHRSRRVRITRGLDRALFEDARRAVNERTPRESATPG